MKLINIILGILILAAAGTGLYYAQQLHVKRYQVKIRGDEMATQAQKLLKNNDDVLGLKFKEKVQPEMLHHQRSAAETANALRPLSEQHKAFMDFQAQNLEKMQTLMKTVGLESFFDLEKARKSKTIDEVSTQMKVGTETLQNRNEGIIEEVVDLGKGFAIDVDREKLANIDDFSLARADFESMNTESKKWFDQLADYERNLDAIADFLNIDKPNFGDQRKNEIEGPYQETFKEMIAVAGKTPVELTETLSEIETLNGQISEKEETSKVHDAEIKELKDAVGKLNQQITDLRAFLVQEWPDIKPWNYATITINITDVNEEGSRLTLDWGKSYKLDGESLAPTNTQYIVALAGNQSGEVILGKIEIDNIEYDKASARIIQMPKIIHSRGDPYMPRKEHSQVEFVPMPLYVFDASKVLVPIYRSTVAKILSISDDHTFAVIDWGKSFKTTQTATKNHFSTPLLPKVALAVSSPTSKTPTGNLLVTRVEDAYSIANVVNTPIFRTPEGESLKMKVGDSISIVPAEIYKIEEAVAQTELLKRRQVPNADSEENAEVQTDEDSNSQAEQNEDQTDAVTTPDATEETTITEEPVAETIVEEEVSVDPVPAQEATHLEATEPIAPEAEIQKEMPVEKQKESKGFWEWLFGSGDDDEELTPETNAPTDEGEIEQLPEVPVTTDIKPTKTETTVAPQLEKKSEILELPVGNIIIEENITESQEPAEEVQQEEAKTSPEEVVEEVNAEETPDEDPFDEEDVVKPEEEEDVVFNQPVQNILRKSEVLHAKVAQKGEGK